MSAYDVRGIIPMRNLAPACNSDGECVLEPAAAESPDMQGDVVLMQIGYVFNPAKAVALMAVLSGRIGPMDKLKLVKLLYLADRDCFLKHGHPITGDRQCAMDHGPVPSQCLDVLNDKIRSDIADFILIQGREITSTATPPQTALLDRDELEIIDSIVATYGSLSTSQLYNLVRELPEYQEVYQPRTSTAIPYESILKHHGTPDQFRDDRPIITEKMRRHMTSPFMKSEPDL